MVMFESMESNNIKHYKNDYHYTCIKSNHLYNSISKEKC